MRLFDLFILIGEITPMGVAAIVMFGLYKITIHRKPWETQ